MMTAGMAAGLDGQTGRRLKVGVLPTVVARSG
jgi:hypothetical protein